MQKRPSRRQAVALLSGLALLLFAGYAITLRANRLEPRKALHLLGERSLVPGAPAALRLASWDLKWERALPVRRLEVVLVREPGSRELLARLHPDRAVVHLNTRIPDWSRGPARLHATVDTDQGTLALQADVWIEPGSASRLRLAPPREELDRIPVLLRQAPGGSREPGPAPQASEPAGFQFFPAGGRLTSTFATRLLIRVVDDEGKPAPGRLQKDQEEPKPTDEAGFIEVMVSEGGMPKKLRLAFDGDGGTLAGDVSLVSEPSQVDVATDRVLARSGRPLRIHLRTLARSRRLFLEAWWPFGWCHTSETDVSEGRGSVDLDLPPGIHGPVLIRVRDDAFGGGKALRDVALMTGRHGLPTLEAAFTELHALPADEGFWQELSGLSSGETSLRALLSRVRIAAGPLPVLADGAEAEREAIARRKHSLRSFGLGSAAAISALLWLSVAWLLLRAALKDPKAGRKRSLATAAMGLCVVALALAGGWVILWWLSAGS